MASRLAVQVSSEVLCAEHGEKLKLFYLDEEKPVCLVCRDSEKHAGHKFLPVDEAYGLYKQKVRESLKPLKEKLKVFDKVKTDYDKTENHIKVQARNTETQIKEQFENLRRVLQEEEEARIATLREEVDRKSQEMKERIEGLTREMETLSNAIQAAEDQLRSDDHVSFLQNYKTTIARVQLTLQDPPLVSRALIDEAKHLMNLTFRVWDKMQHVVSYTPVTLDPNTASPRLMLSDDLTSVRRAGNLQLPDNPERMKSWYRVLGSEGFSSGSHSWDVEVGDHGSWTVGVCVESSNQPKGVTMSGYWFITLGLGLINSLKYFSSFEVDSSDEEFPDSDSDDDDHDDDEWTILAVNQNEMTRFSVKQKPRRIRVQLDWDRGQLSFSDPDSDTRLLHTITHTFTERLFPFVGTGHGDEGSLKMLPGKICVTLENHG